MEGSDGDDDEGWQIAGKSDVDGMSASHHSRGLLR